MESNLSNQNQHYHKSLPVFGMVLVGMIAVLLGVHALAYSDNHISKNTMVNGENIRGMTIEQAQEKVVNYLSKLQNRTIHIRLDGTAYDFRPADVGVNYSVDASIQNLVGMEQQGFTYYVSLIGDFFTTYDFQPVVAFDHDATMKILSEKLPGLQSKRDATFAFEDKKWVVVPSVTGRSADLAGLAQRLEDDAISTDEITYELTSVTQKPDFTTEDAASLVPQITELTSKPHDLVTTVGVVTKRFPIDFQESAESFSVKKSGDTWEVSLNVPWITEKIRTAIVPLIERAAQDVEISGYEDRGGRTFAHASAIAHDGFHLDVDKTISQLVVDIAEGKKETEMVTSVVPAKIKTTQGEWTFTDRVGFGISDYSNSSVDRITNVKLGLSKVNNRIVMPGEVFEFNDHIVPVTLEAGYKMELAIFGGGGVAKVPGGGLCQVATTTYRAFFNGGFQILERSPHSLYVDHYVAFQDGLDATIYPSYGNQKGKDLRAKNDSPYPILLQAFTDDATETAIVQIFGIDDGRKVEVIGPKYVSNKWLGTETIEDPSLPKGVQKIQANGSYGKYIQWFRNITYADGYVKKETVDSLYPGKKKVVRVGTGG